MMKKITDIFHKASSGVLFFFFILITAGCQDEKVNELFEKTASERSLENITSLRELLKDSENGWTVSYKPSKHETGYYQFVFKFLKDSVVEMASDFSQEDLMLRKSEYNIIQGSTTKLSFSTFGALHKLSDSDFSPIPGDRGTGLKGDFEFLYYGKNDAGDLIFRTNRTQDTLIFHKATASSLSDLTLSYANLTNLNEGKSVYRALEETKGTNVVRSAFSFPYEARVITIRSVIKEEHDGEIISSFDDGYTTGYGLTSGGIFLDSVKLSNGTIMKHVEFKFDEDGNRFVTTLQDGTELSIGDVNGPILPVDGQKFMLDPTLTANLSFYLGDPDMGGLTTPAFEERFMKVSQIGLAPQFTFLVQFPYGGKKIDYIILPGTASVTNGNVRQLLIYEDKGDRLVMKRNGFRDPNSAIKPVNEPLYDEFMDFITDPEGFYVENLGRATKYSNQVFTFTSVKDPSVRFGMYHTEP